MNHTREKYRATYDRSTQLFGMTNSSQTSQIHESNLVCRRVFNNNL